MHWGAGLGVGSALGGVRVADSVGGAAALTAAVDILRDAGGSGAGHGRAACSPRRRIFWQTFFCA